MTRSGVQFARIHPLIGNLCIRPDGGVDVAMYRGLTRELSLDDAFALEDIENVDRSWRDARQASLESP